MNPSLVCKYSVLISARLRFQTAAWGDADNLGVNVSDHAGIHRCSEELVQRRDAEVRLAADHGAEEDLRDHLKDLAVRPRLHKSAPQQRRKCFSVRNGAFVPLWSTVIV